MDNQQEQQFIQDCKNGNLAAFGGLYDIYIKKIYSFVFYRVSHQETAEDLTSLVFTKALEAISRSGFDFDNFSAWLYRIARNVVIDYYRTNKQTEDLDEHTESKVSPSNIDKDTDDKLKLQKIKKHLKKFNPEQQEIIMMRIWDDLSYRQIAAITGKSEAALKMTVKRIIEKLKKDPALSLITFLVYRLIN